ADVDELISVVEELTVQVLFDESEDVLQQGVQGLLVRTDGRHSDLRTLKQILIADFRRRDLELVADAALQTLDDHPLLFQPAAARQVQVEDPVRNHHLSSPESRGPSSGPPASLRVPYSADLLNLEGLDDVADLDVLVAVEPDAALEALLDLRDVVLEAAQRPDLPLVDHAVVAEQPQLRAARDRAFRDVAARDDAELRHLERVADLGAPAGDLFQRRLEQAFHRGFDLVGDVVDDRVQAHLDAGFLGLGLRLLLGPDVETDDDGPRRRGEQHVVCVDRAHARVQERDLDLLVGQVADGLREHLHRARDVGLENQ